MLEEFLKEIEELKKYKGKYEYAEKDKKRMSDILYDYMIKEYNSLNFDERASIFKKDTCRCCRYNHECDKSIIPENVGQPIPSDRGWIPFTKGCKDFEWN